MVRLHFRKIDHSGGPVGAMRMSMTSNYGEDNGPRAAVLSVCPEAMLPVGCSSPLTQETY